jgi:hypothetical protein
MSNKKNTNKELGIEKVGPDIESKREYLRSLGIFDIDNFSDQKAKELFDKVKKEAKKMFLKELDDE